MALAFLTFKKMYTHHWSHCCQPADKGIEATATESVMILWYFSGKKASLLDSANRA